MTELECRFNGHVFRNYDLTSRCLVCNQTAYDMFVTFPGVKCGAGAATEEKSSADVWEAVRSFS